MQATPVTGNASQPQAQAPSAAIVADAAKTFTTQDAKGRTLGFRRPSAMDRYRLSKMLGGDVAANQEAAGLAMLAYLCISIDGEAVMKPNSERQIEAIIDRLDNDGLNAIGNALAVELGMALLGDDADQAATKNS